MTTDVDPLGVRPACGAESSVAPLVTWPVRELVVLLLQGAAFLGAAFASAISVSVAFRGAPSGMPIANILLVRLAEQGRRRAQATVSHLVRS